MTHILTYSNTNMNIHTPKVGGVIVRYKLFYLNFCSVGSNFARFSSYDMKPQITQIHK